MAENSAESSKGAGLAIAAILFTIGFLGHPHVASSPDDEVLLPSPHATVWREGNTLCWEAKNCCRPNDERSCVTWTECEYAAKLEQIAPEVITRALPARPEHGRVPKHARVPTAP